MTEAFKTILKIDGEQMEGFMSEKVHTIEKGGTWRNIPSQNVLIAFNDANRNSQSYNDERYDYVNSLLSEHTISIFVIKFVTHKNTYIFAGFHIKQYDPLHDIPDSFFTDPFSEGECYGRFYDAEGRRMFDAEYSIEKHTIQDRALWKGEHITRKATSIRIGKINGSLSLIEKPKDGKPAIFELNGTEYTLGGGRCWEIVSFLITEKAFNEQRAVNLKNIFGNNIGQNFRDKTYIKSRKFFIKCMDHTNAERPYKWYLKC